MLTRYLFAALAATFLAACSSASAHNDCDNLVSGSGGAGGSGSASAADTEAVPCLFAGSVKIAECHDAQLGSVPYCGRNATAPFSDCVSPGINIGDDDGPDQGWVWFCCQATHLIDGGAFP